MQSFVADLKSWRGKKWVKLSILIFSIYYMRHKYGPINLFQLCYRIFLQFIDIPYIAVLKWITSEAPCLKYIEFTELPRLCGNPKMREIKPIRVFLKALERNQIQKGNHAVAAAATRLPKLCQTTWLVKAMFRASPTFSLTLCFPSAALGNLLSLKGMGN